MNIKLKSLRTMSYKLIRLLSQHYISSRNNPEKQTGFTLMEILASILILTLILGPISIYLSRNLTRMAEVRDASIALNLAKKGMERVRSLGFILGSFYVTGVGEGTFEDGSTAPAPRALKARVEKTGSEDISLSINSGEVTGTIPADSPAGTIINLAGSQISDVTGINISGGSSGDSFCILYLYQDSTQTVNETTWRTEYTFVPDTAPLEVRVKVFKESAAEATVELISLVEAL